jgi:hypothetical protein
MIHQLHTLSGILLIASICLKIPVHAYLSYISGKKNPIQSILFFPLTYLGRYRDKVDTKYEGIKNGCNGLFFSTIFFFVMNLVLGILELAIS